MSETPSQTPSQQPDQPFYGGERAVPGEPVILDELLHDLYDYYETRSPGEPLNSADALDEVRNACENMGVLTGRLTSPGQSVLVPFHAVVQHCVELITATYNLQRIDREEHLGLDIPPS